MPFKLTGSLAVDGGRMLIGGAEVPQSTIIANSDVMQIGDKVEGDADGFFIGGAASTAGTDPVGIAVGVATEGGIAVDPDAGTLDTFTVASDNETVLKKYVIIDVSNDTLYSVGADATLGTTTGSDLPNYSMNALASDGGQLDESTAGVSNLGAESFHSWGVDPADSTRVIVNMKQGTHHKLIA